MNTLNHSITLFRETINDNRYMYKKTHTLWKHPTSYSYQSYTWIPSLAGHRMTQTQTESHKALRSQWNVSIKMFWPRDLDLWPMTLTHYLGLDIHPLDLLAKIPVRMSVRSAGRVRRTHTQTYVLRRHMTHADVCSLCATRNGMKALFAPPIFHMYEKYLWT